MNQHALNIVIAITDNIAEMDRIGFDHTEQYIVKLILKGVVNDLGDVLESSGDAVAEDFVKACGL